MILFFSHFSAAQAIEVQIKPDDLHKFNLEVDDVITCGELKAIIEDIQAIPADEFHLAFGKTDLEDSKTLAFYGIGHLDTIEMHDNNHEYPKQQQVKQQQRQQVKTV